MLNRPSQQHSSSLPPSNNQSSRLPSRLRYAAILGTVIVSTAALGAFISVSVIHSQKTDLRAKAAKAEAQLKTDPVAGLVTAIQAIGQNRSRLPWRVLPEVESSLLDAVQTARERNRFELHSRIDAVAFSPDAQTLAAAAEDGNVSVWDRQGNVLQTLEGDGQEIGAIAFSPDGTALLANGIDAAGSIQLWNLHHPSPYQLPANHLALTSAAFSSDGQMLISGNAQGRVQLWSKQGEAIAKLYPRLSGNVNAVAFDGSSLVSAGEDGKITLWNNKGNLLGQLGAGASIHALRVSQSGQHIISQDLNRQQAFLWNGQTSTWNQFLLGETQTIRAADLSSNSAPDSAIVATGDNQGQIHLTALDPQSRTFLPQKLLGHQAAINTVAFSPDNQTVMSGDEQGSLRLWDVQDGTLMTRYHLQEWMKESIQAIALSADGQQIAVSGTNGQVHWGEIDQKRMIQLPKALDASLTDLTLLADGTLAVQTRSDAHPSRTRHSRTISRWSRDGKSLASPISIQSPEPLRTLKSSPDGQFFLSISQTGQLQLWDSQGRVLSAPTQAAATQVLQFSPDGQQIITSTDSGKPQTCLWQIRDNKLIPQFCQAVSSQVIAFQAEGHQVALGTNAGKISLWDLQTNQIKPVLPSGSAGITALAWRPDSQIIAVGHADGKIALFDRQGQPVGGVLVGHQGAIQSLAFRDSNQDSDQNSDQSLVSISREGEVRIWQAGWQAWLRTACNRLQFHSVFQHPPTDDAAEAKAICQRQVWSVRNRGNSTAALATRPVAPVQPSAIPTPQSLRLVVKLGERRVYLYGGDRPQASYPIAIGQPGWETPTGTFKVFEMLQNPAWTHPITGEMIDPGESNPLGDRWIAFWGDGYNQIGFHGTPDRDSVGKNLSHGCLRMFDEDAQALYEQIRLGTVVTVEP